MDFLGQVKMPLDPLVILVLYLFQAKNTLWWAMLLQLLIRISELSVFGEEKSHLNYCFEQYSGKIF